MATLDVGAVHTILDVAKLHNNKEQLDIARILHRKRAIFRTAHWEEANQLTTHVYSKETALPSGVWRGVNQGYTPEEAHHEQGVEPLSRLEGKGQIDEYLIDDIVPNPKQYRYEYDLTRMEGYMQAFTQGVFYGNSTLDPNKIAGLAHRYKKVAGGNVHSAALASPTANEQTSIWIIQWGKLKAAMLYGRNSGAKLIKREDMGKEWVVTNPTTGEGLYKYTTRFYSVAGLCVYDDRAVQRICNIEADRDADDATLDAIRENVIWAIDSLPDDEKSGTYIYANRLGKYLLKRAVRSDANVIWTTDKDDYGMIRDHFYGVPIQLDEGIRNDEPVVT